MSFIDTTFIVFSDTPKGKDADKYSSTLRKDLSRQEVVPCLLGKNSRLKEKT